MKGDDEMKKVTLVESHRSKEDSYTSMVYAVELDGELIGELSLMVDDESAYIERLDIDEEYRNQGYGTQATKMIAAEYDEVYAAPDNSDSQRLLERIGTKTDDRESEPKMDTSAFWRGWGRR
jgi:RimJ/RimL family protein N-acetyltransferase